jgi:CHAT domain-containing protein
VGNWQQGKAMRAMLGGPGVLLLLAACVLEAAGQPLPVPQDQAAQPVADQQGLLAEARQLDAEGDRYYQRGDLREAMRLLREALEVRRKAYPRDKHPRGHADVARSLSNLGFLHQAVGEYAQAEALFLEALAMDRGLFPKERYPHGHAELALILSNLGALHRAAGEHAKAEPLLQEALAIRRALYPPERFPHGHAELAISVSNLGALYHVTGDYARAEPLYREALGMQRALYPPERYPHGHAELVRSITNLAHLHLAAAQYVQAEPLLGEAVAMSRALYPKERYPDGHPDLARALSNLGFLEQAVGAHARAESLLGEALAMLRALYPKQRFPHGHPQLAVTIHNLGVLHCAAGEHTRAEAFFREALAMHSQLLRQLADLAAEAESQSFASSLPQSRDVLLSNSWHLAQSAAAYEALWDSRAVLTRVQERRHRDLVASADPATAALADELQGTRQRLSRLLLAPGRDAQAHRQAVAQLTQAKEDLEKRIAQKLPVRAIPPAAAATTAKQLSAALPPGAVFVDLIRYVYSEYDPRTPGVKGRNLTTSYVAFVARTGQPVARVELGAALPIEKAWAAWHKALLAPAGDPKTERAAAWAFAKLVWEPIRAALPAACDTLYLTPDGVLTQVPWAVLPGKRPATVLLEDHGVCLVPHGPWLLERLSGKASGGRKPLVDTLVAYGGIDYEGASAAVAKSRSLRALGVVGADKWLHWAALPGTAHEQAQIVALAQQALHDAPLIRSGRVASTEQLLADLPRARYAHLATHGFFADARFRSYLQVDAKLYEQSGLGGRHAAAARSPLVLSGLVLAGANRQGEDAAPDRGIVTAEALIGLRLENLELAVLSACETGLGEVAGGEGVFGLQRAFHIAGCPNVIASLWQVDDEATAALMSVFYYHLWALKKTPAEALRQAQLTLYHHPERIAQLARLRGPDFEKAARLPATPQAAARAPMRLWAGFVLSGLGR